MPTLDVLFPIVQQHQSLVSGIAIGLIIFLTVRYFQSPWRKHLPGPRGLPLPGKHPKDAWQAMARFHEVEARIRYVSTIFLMNASQATCSTSNTAGQPLIVLNTQKVGAVLLDRRAGNIVFSALG